MSKHQISNNVYKSIFESNLDAILIINSGDKIMDANPAAELLFGYSLNELIKLNISELADKNKPQLSAILNDLTIKSEVKIEITLIRKDDSKFPAEIFPIHLVNKNVNNQTSLIIRDINNRKQLEEEKMIDLLEQLQKYNEELTVSNEELHSTTEDLRIANEELQQQGNELLQVNKILRDSEKRFQSLIETSPLGISLSNPEGEILEINSSWLKIFGYDYDSKQDFISRPTSSYYYEPEDRTRFFEQTKFGKVINFQTRFKHRDGSVFWGSLSSTAMTTTNNKKVLISTFQDINERKKDEKTLNESESSYRSLFETMSEGFSINEIIYDDGNPYDIRYLDVNPAFEKHTGLKKNDIIGKTRLELFPNSEQTWFEQYGSVLLTGEPKHFEEWLGPLNRCFDVYAFQTEPHRIAVMFTDITERKNNEWELEKLNRTLRALTDSTRAKRYAKDESEYLDEVCKIIIEDCGYAMVWIGFTENDENKTVKPIAYSGFEAGYLETLGITWEDIGRGRGPTGTAIRTGENCVCRNMLNDPQFEPWREEAIKRGYASSLALPLMNDGNVFGALTIYSRESNPFSEDEINLLTELVDDISYGIITLRLSAAKSKTEVELQESERKYHSLYSSMSEGVALHKIIYNSQHEAVDYIILDINPAYENIIGLKRSEVIGMKASQLYGTGTPPYLEFYAPVAENGEPTEFETYFEPMDIIFRISVISPEKGKFATLFEDITERKRAELERDTNVEFLRLVNENTSVRDLIQSAVTFFKQQSECEAVGIRLKEGDDYPYYETRGFPEEFLLMENRLCAYDKLGNSYCDSDGNPIIECICGNVICGRFDASKPFFTDNGSFWTNSTTNLLANTSEEDRQSTTRNRCNGMGYESVALIPLPSRVGNLGLLQLNDIRKDMFSPELIAVWERLAGYLAVALEKFQADEEIIRHDELLESINRVFQEALTCDTEEDVIGKCLEVAEELTDSEFGFVGEVNENGRLDDIALSPPAWEACRTTNAHELLSNMEIVSYWGRTIREGKSQIVNDPDFDPDQHGLPEGHPHITSFLGVPLKQGSKTIGMIALANKKAGYNEEDKENIEVLSVAFVEALMRKRAEVNLKENVKDLKRSNRELEQFAYVSSHDLQEPIRMVTSFTQLLERKYKGELDADADEYINFIVEGSHRMKYLIDDLLAFSRVSSDTKEFENVDLENVLDVVLSNLYVSINESNAFITHDPLPTVLADESQMGQVFQNLISNAIKFSGDKTPIIHISAHKDGKEWRFSVTDNGIGIESEYQKQIFEVFKRLHTRSEYPGSGIGLSVSHKIIEHHDGNIWVESESGEGSTFYFTIPNKT